MDIVYERCAALDLAKRSLVACLRLPHRQEVQTFGTMTDDLLALADWLHGHAVTHVAMEATGPFWKPVYNLLESYDFELMLVNPHEFKAVPGRKTDVRDAEWRDRYGPPTCSGTGCSGPASFPTGSTENSGSWCATGSRSWRSAPAS